MLKLGLDIDDVVCEMVPTVIERINVRFQTNYSKADITDWFFETEEFNLYDEILKTFADKKNMMNFPVVQGATVGVWYIKAYFGDQMETMFVTSRPAEYRRYTERWIAKNFGKYRVEHVNGNKNRLGLDILVDDAPHNIRDFAAQGKPCVVFDQPWNRTEAFDGELVRRASSWFQVVNAIEELKSLFYPKGDDSVDGRGENQEGGGERAPADST